jgi:dipeptidyl-peptidase-4
MRTLVTMSTLIRKNALVALVLLAGLSSTLWAAPEKTTENTTEKTSENTSGNSMTDNNAITVTAENYARAERFLKPNVAGLVKNLLVIPHWIGSGHQFWYPRETAGGVEFTLVDAATGKKSVLFDHQALADWLTQQGASDVTPNKLPLGNLDVDAHITSIRFTLNDKVYTCPLKTMQCEATPKPEFAPELLVSPDQAKGVKTVAGNLVLVDLKSGQEKALTTDGAPHFGYGIYYGNWKADYIARQRAGHDFPPMASEWSPSGQKVLVTRLDERAVKEYPFIESAPVDGTHRPIVHTPRIPLTGEPPPPLDWFVFDIKTGQKVRLDLPYDKLLHVHQDLLAVRTWSWDEARGKLYAVAHGDYMQAAYFFEIDLKTGQSREVVSEHMLPRTDLNSTSYNPPNVRYLPATRELIWFSQENGWGHLYLYDVASGQLKNPITAQDSGGNWLVRDILKVDEQRRVIYFSGTHREGGSPYDRYLYKVNFDGTGLMLLGDEKADHMVTSPWNDILAIDGAKGYDVVSPDGDYLVYNYSRVDQPTRTAIRSTATGQQVAIFEEADTTALYAAGWQDPEEFVALAEDGKTELWSVLYKPAGLDPRQSYPIIDSQYISPLTAVVPRNFLMAVQGTHDRVAFQSTASLHFAVVIIDARGTAYRNRDFMHYSYGNLNTAGFEDHVAVIRQLKDKYAWIDLDRVGVHGSSYGGFGTFRAMFEFPEFYKVGVANVGVGAVHNMYPDYHWEAFHDIAEYENGTRYYSDPTEKPLNYLNNDTTIQAVNLRGKLLIMLGELDENVLPATTLQTIDALIKADRDFDMIYNPSDNHHYRKPFTIRKMLDYFVRYLHHQEPPEYHFTSLDNSIKSIKAAES